MLERFANFATVAAFLVTLVAIAWSAYNWVLLQRAQQADLNYRRFFDLMRQFRTEECIASKMAAAYELRKYHDYADVIVRFCEGAPVEGAAGELLKTELKHTAQYYRQLKGIA